MNWISVEQRLPDERQVVIITDGLAVHIGYRIYNRWFLDRFLIGKKQDINGAISHWMPFPDPPTEINIFDKEEIIPNCTVQVLENSVTGAVSVGYWRENNAPET